MCALPLGLLAALVLFQDPMPPEAPPRVAVLAGMVHRDGSFAFERLGLGDGGIAAKPTDAHSDGEGRFVTSGGVLVRALAEGVKLDFPSGGELLVDTRARVHLRDGSRTLPSSSGVRLILLDGATVDVLPQNGSDRPLRQVVVRDGGVGALLWRAGRTSSRRDRGGAFHGRTLHAFGDGRALYEVADVGVAVVLDRVLCPSRMVAQLPPVTVAVVGDVLARSLVELGEVARQRAAGDPRTQQVASALAANAARMFGRPHERPAGARGELMIPLEGGFRLRLHVPSGGPLILSLLAQGDDVPLCEWTTTNVTRLHLIQRNAGEKGAPRYLMRGYALRHMLDPLLGFEPSPTARARARRALAELTETSARAGGVDLPVERRG